jgi:hypothetical protein
LLIRVLPHIDRGGEHAGWGSLQEIKRSLRRKPCRQLATCSRGAELFFSPLPSQEQYMKPTVAITLIVCGTLMAAMPIIAHRLGMQIADIGAFCFFGLAAIMIGAGIVGSTLRLGSQAGRNVDA